MSATGPGLVASKYDRVDLEQVPASVSDWLSVLERIVWHMDGPGYSPAVFPLWRIMERARASGTPVVLEGQGADELLGGYTQYAAVALWDSLSRLRLLNVRPGFRPVRAYVLGPHADPVARQGAGLVRHTGIPPQSRSARNTRS